MRKVEIASTLLAGIVVFTPVLQADTLIFHNGNRVDGTLVSVDSQSLRFNVGNHVNTYNRTEIDSVQFSGSGYNQYSAPAPPPQAQNAYPPSPPDNASAANSMYSGVQVPAGSEIVVRLIDHIDSETDRLGQTYRASLDQPVVVNGQQVIPRGADATATLIDAKNSGKIQGRTSLTVDLKAISFNGQMYDLTTSGVTQQSGSRGARSAKVIGGTAALGALIGGLAGGGKGAAIGAGSGAGVGTVAEVATSGQRVKVPAETRLSFTLENPINLR